MGLTTQPNPIQWVKNGFNVFKYKKNEVTAIRHIQETAYSFNYKNAVCLLDIFNFQRHVQVSKRVEESGSFSLSSFWDA